MDEIAFVGQDEQGDSACPSYRTDNGSQDRKVVPSSPPPAKRGRTALIWGIASTVLSGVGFIALALFEQYNSSLSELRSDLKHFNETSSEFVKTEYFQKFREQTKTYIKELQATSVGQSQLEKELRISEKAREEMTREMQRLRERLAFVEGQHSALPNSYRSIPANSEIRGNEQNVNEEER
jgi:hypothetical protein